MGLPLQIPWVCDRSGECCRDVVLTPEEWAVLHEVRPDCPAPVPFEGRFLLFQGRCPLLNETRRCTVYPVRPFNCRRFLCGRADAATEPLVMDTHGTGTLACANFRVRFLTSRPFRRQAQRIQTKAQAWALAHGWTAEDV